MVFLKNSILQGDVLEVIKNIPDEYVDCIITSPPYWGLRDYGVEGQIGLEPTLDEYLQKMLAITAELKRVLKDTGVLFWDHGDCYSAKSTHANKKGITNYDNLNSSYGDKTGRVVRYERKFIDDIPPKCLVLQNFRLVLRLVDEQGWILRNVIIWHKPNGMPASVRDRFANKYEPVFMLVKNKKYWFDLDAVRVPQKVVFKAPQRGKKRIMREQLNDKTNPGFDERINHPLGKNPGDVWDIPTQPFPEAHFATYPERLVEPMIKAGCPAEICRKCGKARERISKDIEEKITTGWTDCGCGAGWRPGIVLDPFLGSGTTALVALRLGRDFIGIELNLEYIAITKKRLNKLLYQRRLRDIVG